MLLGETLNSAYSAPQTMEFCLRILLAAVCGAAIGFERTRRYKEAGIRTHVIVCAAAALLMIVSKYSFADLSAADGFISGTTGTDPARIAAQVVTGIGFLGAGVIFKNGSTVKGLTTAAGIWATAGIGLTIGAGLYWIGLFATVLLAIMQILMHRFTFGSDATVTYVLKLKVRDGTAFHNVLQDRLQAWKAQAVKTHFARAEDNCISYELTLRTRSDITAEDLMAFSREHEEILEISSEQTKW